MVVVFPAPLWPRNPKISRASTEKEMLSTARRLLNARERFSTSIAGILAVLYALRKTRVAVSVVDYHRRSKNMRTVLLCSLFILLAGINSSAKPVHHYVFFGMDREKLKDAT